MRAVLLLEYIWRHGNRPVYTERRKLGGDVRYLLRRTTTYFTNMPRVVTCFFSSFQTKAVAASADVDSGFELTVGTMGCASRVVTSIEPRRVG